MKPRNKIHREVYSIVIDNFQSDPRKAVSYPEGCDNYDWQPKYVDMWTDIDKRWNNIFVFKDIEKSHSLAYDNIYIKIVGDWHSETYKISFTNFPKQGYEKLGESEYSHSWFNNCLAVMMLKRLDARGIIKKERWNMENECSN